MLLPVALFLFALITTTFAGTQFALDFERNAPPYTSDVIPWLFENPERFLQGLYFALPVMGLLGIHELGHYLASRLYRVDVSLPYFLPGPPPIGTFGAFIRMRQPVFRARVLFDIAAAGPLAGFLATLPVLALGLAWSRLSPRVEPEPLFQLPLLMHGGVSFLFPGYERSDLLLHPTAYGAWVSLFGTALNLLPIGQLDGGKLFYCFAPEWHRTLSRIFIVLMVVLGLAVHFYSWVIIAVLMWFTPPHPPLFPGAPGRQRALLALACLGIFALCFVPVPLRWL